MNTVVLLPLQESMVKCGAGIHDQWQGCMAIDFIDHGKIQPISIPTTDDCPMIKIDVYTVWNSFRLDVQWTLAICLQR